jgi:hypothetical protein
MYQETCRVHVLCADAHDCHDFHHHPHATSPISDVHFALALSLSLALSCSLSHTHTALSLSLFLSLSLYLSLFLSTDPHGREALRVCVTCGKGFSQAGALTTHARTHTGENLLCARPVARALL